MAKGEKMALRRYLEMFAENGDVILPCLYNSINFSDPGNQRQYNRHFKPSISSDESES